MNGGDALYWSRLRDVYNDVPDLPVEVCRIDKVLAVDSVDRCTADVLVGRKHTKADEPSGCDECRTIVGLES